MKTDYYINKSDKLQKALKMNSVFKLSDGRKLSQHTYGSKDGDI